MPHHIAYRLLATVHVIPAMVLAWEHAFLHAICAAVAAAIYASFGKPRPPAA